MWVYHQKLGSVRKESTGEHYSGLYSGDKVHHDDPMAQHLVGQGPIPQNAYWIGYPVDTKDHGPYFIPLVPITPGEQMFGRSAFGMHGDEIGHVGEYLASHGCIIAPMNIRQKIGADVGHLLIVLSGFWTP